MPLIDLYPVSSARTSSASAEEEKAGKLPFFKRVVPHLLLVIGVIVYVVLGAKVFQNMERIDGRKVARRPLDSKVHDFLHYVREKIGQNASLEDQMKLEDLLNKLQKNVFKFEVSKQNENFENHNFSSHGHHSWESFYSAVLFAFTTVSTIGYGHIYPSSNKGRLFCILYTLIGIPLFMITVADIGKFLWEGLGFVLNKIIRKIRGEKSQENDDLTTGELSLFVSVPLLVFSFLSYIILGALLLPTWEKMNFLEASYFCFISVTTVGFGDVVPENPSYLIPTCLYIFFGLSLTTLAIELLATAFRRVHYLGRQIKGAASAKVWLGHKMLSLNDLMRSVGKEMGATEEQMRRLGQQLDKVLENAVEEVEKTGTVTLKPEEKLEVSLIILDSPVKVPNHRKFSGEYDNIPESWVSQNIMFMDDDTSRVLLPANQLKQ